MSDSFAVAEGDFPSGNFAIAVAHACRYATDTHLLGASCFVQSACLLAVWWIFTCNIAHLNSRWELFAPSGALWKAAETSILSPFHVTLHMYSTHVRSWVAVPMQMLLTGYELTRTHSK